MKLNVTLRDSGANYLLKGYFKVTSIIIEITVQQLLLVCSVTISGLVRLGFFFLGVQIKVTHGFHWAPWNKHYVHKLGRLLSLIRLQ